MITVTIFESPMFAKGYSNSINDTSNLDTYMDETHSTIDKKLHLFDHFKLINDSLMCCTGGIHSIYIIYQLIYDLYISKY